MAEYSSVALLQQWYLPGLISANENKTEYIDFFHAAFSER